MRNILQKLKRKPLLEELQERFPQENVKPYGLCLIIPLQMFPKFQEEELKKQGYRVYYQGFKGQTCAFIGLSKQVSSSDAVNSKPFEVPDKKPERSEKKAHAWTPQQETILKTLYSEGKNVKEISAVLGFSIYVIGAKIGHLCKPRHQQKPNPTVREKATQTNIGDVEVKEFLAAASVLYPNYKHASALLLKTAADKVLLEAERGR